MTVILPRGNRDLIRSLNRSIILNVIKTEGEVSRATIANLTKLSPATVTGITSQLIQEDLIFEKATGDSKGGRPPIILALNPRGGFVVGIKLMEGQAVGALTDLNATILAKEAVNLATNELDASLDALSKLINLLIHRADISRKKLLGVGIGLAGVVDFNRGILRQNPFLGWENVPLRDLLQKRLRVPVYIDNDVNTLTLGEQWLSSGQPVDNFLVITIGRGVGMGIVIHGQLYRGKCGGAGELGHMVVDPDGSQCDCGKRGCLESLIGERALIEAARREVSPEVQDIDVLIKLAEDGHPAARSILERAGTVLGRQIANVTDLFDPNLIIISGEGVRMGERFFTAMRSAFHQCVMPGLVEDTEIRIDTWGDDIWALGAAGLVIAEIFNSPIHKEESREKIGV